MQDNPRSEPTPEEIKRLLQEAILRNYPNPERRGCFNAITLKLVAGSRFPSEAPQWEHITHCSPCYQEFLGHRATALSRRNRRRFVSIAGIAAIVVLATIWASLMLTAPKTPLPETARLPSSSQTEEGVRRLTAVLNMQASPTRGGEETPGQNSDLQRLPRAKMSPLLIYLPFGSDPGTYRAELMYANKEKPPLTTFAGSAEIRNGLTVLQISADLSRFDPGTYMLSVSREGTTSRSTCRFILF
jgi:hypothetical protein